MMKTKLQILWVLAGFMAGADLMAQVSNYNFSQTTGSYGPPNTGSVIGVPFQDDDVNTVSLPFTFNFNGTSYTSINVCSNGYLSFSGLSGTEFYALSDGGTQEVIAPFSQDLLVGMFVTGDVTAGSNTITNVSSLNGFGIGDVIWDYFLDFGGTNPVITGISGNSIIVNINATTNDPNTIIPFLNGSIKQMVSGTAPNRICEFEYKNCCRLIPDEVINFKVRLYETSNKIEFVYGSMFPGFDNINSEVGLKGLTQADFNSRYVDPFTSWTNSVPATTIFDDCDFSDIHYPQTGLHYIWTLTVCATPTLNVVQSNTNICPGQSATITAFGASSYSWSTGSTTNPLVINPTTTTTYTLNGFNDVCSATLAITQSVTLAPVVAIIPSQSVICTGQSAVLQGVGANTYSWNTGNAGPQIVVAPLTNTTYVLMGTNGPCTSTISQQIVVSPCTGVDASETAYKEFSVFPNPSNGSFTIKMTATEFGATIKIYNMLGAEVYSGTSTASEMLINTAVPDGIYLLELHSDGQKQFKQLVISK